MMCLPMTMTMVHYVTICLHLALLFMHPICITDPMLSYRHRGTFGNTMQEIDKMHISQNTGKYRLQNNGHLNRCQCVSLRL